MREINNENMNTFYGLVIEGLTIKSVWKFNVKGSLQDIFDHSTFKWDWFIKYSFIRDLANVSSPRKQSMFKKRKILE